MVRSEQGPDILDIEASLVSSHCGLIRTFKPVYKDVTEPREPYIWRAELANHRFIDKGQDAMVVASGKGFEPADARRSALGEAVERYCGLRFPTSEVVLGCRAELDGDSIDPRRLVLHTPDQLERLGFSAYHDELDLLWVRGRCLTTGGPVWIPAQAVSLVQPPEGAILFQATSNGMAAGASHLGACIKALLEVVERDAFLAAWYHRLRPVPINWRSHPDPRVVGLGEAYGRRGVLIECYLLPTDHGIPVVVGLAIEDRPGGVAAVVGLGADLSLSNAVRSAMLEVGQVRPAIRVKLRDQEHLERRAVLVANPAEVAALEDHDLLYTDRSMLGAFDMWRNSTMDAVDIHDAPLVEDALDTIVQKIGTTGCRAVVCDITSPELRQLGLFVSSAVIEDFQPIHFGEKEFRAGGSRFYELPRLLGLKPGLVRREELNPLPHPLS